MRTKVAVTAACESRPLAGKARHRGRGSFGHAGLSVTGSGGRGDIHRRIDDRAGAVAAAVPSRPRAVERGDAARAPAPEAGRATPVRLGPLPVLPASAHEWAMIIASNGRAGPLLFGPVAKAV